MPGTRPITRGFYKNNHANGGVDNCVGGVIRKGDELQKKAVDRLRRLSGTRRCNHCRICNTLAVVVVALIAVLGQLLAHFRIVI